MNSKDVLQLYNGQLQEFELAKKNYTDLQQAVYRDIPFDLFRLRIQYNPARMISTNARIDVRTLQNRKCFLCREHMPEAQKGIRYNDRYSIFINPYPIFERHFTVPSRHHEPQCIGGRFEDLLDLTFDFQGYTLFYNGPTCGASAPDHFHFQMCPRHLMPLEEDAANEELRRYLVKKDYYSVSILKDYLREVILLQASDSHLLSVLFRQTMEIIGRSIPFEEEPMINLLGWFDNCQWTVCLFPRRTRRPRQFYAEGTEKILFSPGCVDMAGLIISPREEDFRKYSAGLLTDMFSQVTAGPDSWEAIQKELIRL